MRVPYDLLSPGLRSGWVTLPAWLGHPEHGTARLKLQEIPRAEFDLLWGEMLAAQTACEQAPATLTPKEIADLNEALRAAEDAITCRCVVDHSPLDFTAVDPDGGTVAISFSKERIVSLYRACTPNGFFFGGVLLAIRLYQQADYAGIEKLLPAPAPQKLEVVPPPKEAAPDGEPPLA